MSWFLSEETKLNKAIEYLNNNVDKIIVEEKLKGVSSKVIDRIYKFNELTIKNLKWEHQNQIEVMKKEYREKIASDEFKNTLIPAQEFQKIVNKVKSEKLAIIEKQIRLIKKFSINTFPNMIIIEHVSHYDMGGRYLDGRFIKHRNGNKNGYSLEIIIDGKKFNIGNGLAKEIDYNINNIPGYDLINEKYNHGTLTYYTLKRNTTFWEEYNRIMSNVSCPTVDTPSAPPSYDDTVKTKVSPVGSRSTEEEIVFKTFEKKN